MLWLKMHEQIEVEKGDIRIAMGNEQPFCFGIIENRSYTLHCKSLSKVPF